MAIGDTITVNDKMQRGYRYELAARRRAAASIPASRRTSPRPKCCIRACSRANISTTAASEFPASWFSGAKLSDVADPSLNAFGIKSRQPLSVWRDKGWIIGPDPRGWFQWYCRYYLGRRIPDVDASRSPAGAALPATPRRCGTIAIRTI